MTEKSSVLTRHKAHPSDRILTVLIYICSAFSVMLVGAIIIYILVRGAGALSLSFLTTETSVLNGTVGIAGNIVNTLYIIVITMLIATPIGVRAAVYLN